MKTLLKKIKFNIVKGFRHLIFNSVNILLFFPGFVDVLIKFSRFCINIFPYPANLIGSWRIVNSLYQRFPFELEKAYFKKGRQRVEDPLFLSFITPGNRGKINESVGTYNVYFQFNSMVIEGLVIDGKGKSVDLILSGKKIRRLNCQSGSGYHTFLIKLDRTVIETFPKESDLTIRMADSGKLLTFMHSESARLNLPHGKNTLFDLIDLGSSITKKGQLTEPEDLVIERQNAYLELYTQVRDFFVSELNLSLFAMYGTLLGIYREGDFIKGDDDFDGGFIVNSTHPADVKRETKEIIMRLIKAGFIVSFNRWGKLFRIQTKEGFGHGIHLDLRPVWFESGNMWAHLQACIPGEKDDFLPVQTTKLRGIDIDIPRNPEVLLEGYYGKGWKVPDPGYVNDLAKNQSYIIKTLNKTLITPREYLSMKKELTKTGDIKLQDRFVSTAYRNLYPLSNYSN